MRLLFYPIGFLYWLVTTIRNQLFDLGLWAKVQLPIPVVSVGNITVGGTGKTPLLATLLEWARGQNLNAAVVSRGYGGNYVGVQRVPVDGSSKVFGDEPVMLAKHFRDVPVYVCRKRVIGVEAILKNENIDLVFADDGFQHRHLGRQVDILIMDATEPIEAYRILPVGRARESVYNISRADYIILNKVNMVSPDQKSQLIDFVESKMKSNSIPLIECEYHISRIRNAKSDEKKLPDGESVILVSGIGRPGSFEQLLSGQFKVMNHLICRDHIEYAQSHINELKNLLKKHNTSQIITTEKDFVKLSRFEGIIEHLWVAELRPKLGLRARMLFDDILHLHKSEQTKTIGL